MNNYNEDDNEKQRSPKIISIINDIDSDNTLDLGLMFLKSRVLSLSISFIIEMILETSNLNLIT